MNNKTSFTFLGGSRVCPRPHPGVSVAEESRTLFSGTVRRCEVSEGINCIVVNNHRELIAHSPACHLRQGSHLHDFGNSFTEWDDLNPFTMGSENIRKAEHVTLLLAGTPSNRKMARICAANFLNEIS